MAHRRKHTLSRTSTAASDPHGRRRCAHAAHWSIAFGATMSTRCTVSVCSAFSARVRSAERRAPAVAIFCNHFLFSFFLSSDAREPATHKAKQWLHAIRSHQCYIYACRMQYAQWFAAKFATSTILADLPMSAGCAERCAARGRFEGALFLSIVLPRYNVLSTWPMNV